MFGHLAGVLLSVTCALSYEEFRPYSHPCFALQELRLVPRPSTQIWVFWLQQLVSHLLGPGRPHLPVGVGGTFFRVERVNEVDSIAEGSPVGTVIAGGIFGDALAFGWIRWII